MVESSCRRNRDRSSRAGSRGAGCAPRAGSVSAGDRRVDGRRGFSLRASAATATASAATRPARNSNQSARPGLQNAAPRRTRQFRQLCARIAPAAARTARARPPAASRNGPTSSCISARNSSSNSVAETSPAAAGLRRGGRSARPPFRAGARPRRRLASGAIGGGEAAGALAERQRLGDRVAGESVGAVRPARRLAGGEKSRHACSPSSGPTAIPPMW